MSDDIVIRVERLGKKYVIGHQAERERYVALRDVLVRSARNAWRKTADMARGRTIVAGDTVEEFWALKDVSFEVRRGEVLGIIGRNGAGKSTLLKILSRITEPNEGRVTIDGRVASLLEVGTGFHPELTGRENIYLNGAILGMTRAEIRCKFDEIVAFADVERFLDTPVKRYSNGMYVRLAFSVAAHLEPEILLVDEVLAVGDAEFQKKCLRKMHEVASKLRRTVLFVSHNLTAVQSLCDKAVLMSGGRSAAIGEVEPILHAYLANMRREAAEPLDRRIDREGSGDVRFVSVSFEDARGVLTGAFRCGAEARLSFTVDNCTGRNLRNVHISIGIDNEMAQRVALLDSEMIGAGIAIFPPGRQKVRVTVPRMALIPGRYHLTLFSTVNGVIADWIKSACFMDVEEGQYFSTGRLPPLGQAMFLLDHRLDYKEENDDLNLSQDSHSLGAVRQC
jgi:lipopolysaccharide transport system ATP-binding protein